MQANNRWGWIGAGSLLLAACGSEGEATQRRDGLDAGNGGSAGSGSSGGSAGTTSSGGSAGSGSSGGSAGTTSSGGSAGSGSSGGSAGTTSSGGSAGSGSSGGSAGTTSSGGSAGTTATDAGTCSWFATSVVAHAWGPGQNFGQAEFPDPLLGPPRGGGCCQGGLDVIALGNGGTVTLAFDARIVDGAGPDFIVFENPFEVAGGTSVFAELASVEVSADGNTWHAFPCTAAAAPYGTCAGHGPVYANADTNSIDPRDPLVAGGDAFDLSDVGVAEARFVRITDRVDLTGTSGVFDLDAVSIVHGACD